MSNSLLCILTLWQREVVRFYRDKGRVIGGFMPPVIFWIFIGSGFSGSLRIGGDDGISYMQYFFPGILTLIFLFTSVFSTISIIEDKKEGFLQSVLVAPVQRYAIVLGKIFGSTTLAFIQGIPFLIIGYFAGVHIHLEIIWQTFFILFAVAFILASTGFIIAWILDSTQGFHAIMNMFLIPLWILSGALFPTQNLPVWLEWVVRINPITYAVAALQHIFFQQKAIESLPTMQQCAIVLTVYGVAIFMIALFVARKGDSK